MSISTTYKQAKLLDYIETYMARTDGIAPSLDEMKDAMGLVAKSGVFRLLEALEERGKIVRIRKRSRAITILPDNPFDGIPTDMLVAELTRRGEEAGERRKAA